MDKRLAGPAADGVIDSLAPNWAIQAKSLVSAMPAWGGLSAPISRTHRTAPKLSPF